MTPTLEQLTAWLVRAGVNPDGHGERPGESQAEFVQRLLDTAEIRAIVEYDKRVNWPRIEAQVEPEYLAFVPTQDGVKETL